MPRARHIESHVLDRVGWLRAAVLGANDGIVSTASLIVGVASAGQPKVALLLTGVAGLVAGAMSMAAGEYVSVSSQADTEAAEVARETMELDTQPDAERDELIGIWRERGLDVATAETVADQLTAFDALATHSRDELGLIDAHAARPVQAAVASAAAFSVGAALPLATAMLSPAAILSWSVSIASLAFLVLLGAVGAKAGGAPVARSVLRVAFWGAFAMAATAAIGHVFGTSVA